MHPSLAILQHQQTTEKRKENRRSSRGGGGAHLLHPPPRSASVLGATTGAGLLGKTALRGGQFDKNESIKEMNLTDDTVVDFAPLLTRFEKQYNKTFLTA